MAGRKYPLSTLLRFPLMFAGIVGSMGYMLHNFRETFNKEIEDKRKATFNTGAAVEQEQDLARILRDGGSGGKI